MKLLLQLKKKKVKKAEILWMNHVNLVGTVSIFPKRFTLFILFFRSYICFKRKINIPILVTGILAGLVSITGE